MKSEKLIFKAAIISIAVLMSIYSLKFFSLFSQKIGIKFPIILDPKWWRPPRNLFIYASLLLLFLLTFLFRKAASFKTKSAMVAFFVSLLFEMYGLGFSLYFIYMLLGRTKSLAPYINYPHPQTFFHHLVRFPVLIICWTLGLFLIMKGWAKVFNAKGALVTDGAYKYLRHPQYLGFIIILAGSLFFFPTPLLLLLFIILAVMYCRLARIEERELELRFAGKYREYKNNTAMWIPLIKKRPIRQNV